MVLCHIFPSAGPSHEMFTSSQHVPERNQDATIYVGNLTANVSEELLWELFLQSGPVVNVHIPKDKVTNVHQVNPSIDLLIITVWNGLPKILVSRDLDLLNSELRMMPSMPSKSWTWSNFMVSLFDWTKRPPGIFGWLDDYYLKFSRIVMFWNFRRWMLGRTYSLAI